MLKVVHMLLRAAIVVAAAFMILPDGHAETRHGYDRFSLTHMEQDSLVQYGTYRESKFVLTSDYYHRFRLAGAYVFESVIPPGLKITTHTGDRRNERTNTILISGKPLFVGKWCFNLALQVKTKRRMRRNHVFIERLCFFSDDNRRYRYTKLDVNLPTAMKGSPYRVGIRLERGRHYRRGVHSQVVWHDVPVSVQVRNNRRMITISGTPEDRYGYRLPRGYKAYGQPVKLGKFNVDDDLFSKFTYRYPMQHGYRITAMYPDGETRSNFVRLVKVSRGEVVVGRLHYRRFNGNEPLYFNVFRSSEDNNRYQFVARIPARGSGRIHVIDTNLPSLRSLKAEGTYYINVKHRPRLRNARVSYQQFEFTIVE